MGLSCLGVGWEVRCRGSVGRTTDHPALPPDGDLSQCGDTPGVGLPGLSVLELMKVCLDSWKFSVFLSSSFWCSDESY